MKTEAWWKVVNAYDFFLTAIAAIIGKPKNINLRTLYSVLNEKHRPSSFAHIVWIGSVSKFEKSNLLLHLKKIAFL